MPLYPEFSRAYSTNDLKERPSAWILFRGHSILVRAEGESVRLPREEEPGNLGLSLEAPIVLGRWKSEVYAASEISEETPLPEGWEAFDLRTLYSKIDEVEWAIAGYAAQVLYWRRTSGFCPVCGSEMGEMGPEWRRRCIPVWARALPHGQSGSTGARP